MFSVPNKMMMMMMMMNLQKFLEPDPCTVAKFYQFFLVLRYLPLKLLMRIQLVGVS